MVDVSGFSPVFDLNKKYAQYSKVLKDAKEGEVVTRFPPEPSGYLHIGHVKAALLNFHYANIYKGKMILRFDDTNPSKEKEEYVGSILEDLKTLRITYDKLTYTSDSFELLQTMATEQIKKGVFYCDNTPVEQMRKERGEGIESACRNSTPEQNLEIWNKMLEGDKAFSTYCVRAKIGMQIKNKCMRDPVMYRTNDTPHHRTGTKFKVYPTYDYSCPIVDSIEGVTHTLRTNEYSDRNEQFHWIQNTLGLRKVIIYDFSRLCFVNTCLSKRKLQWFVDSGRVESWEDPRFPTLRGIIRRGIRVETLIEFMLEQGPSKNTNLMEWDKLWAINKKIIDPISPRYTAISSNNTAKLTLVNGPSPTSITTPAHPSNPAYGDKLQFRSTNILIEGEDANDIKIGDKVTLMKWGNALVKEILKDGENIQIVATIDEEDKDFKNTKKLTWLSQDSNLIKIHLVEYDHLIKVKKVEEGVEFMDILNDPTMLFTEAVAEPFVKNCQIGDIVQFERRGYFILDKRVGGGETEEILHFVYIPDGKSKSMSTLSTKVDVKANIKGQNMPDKAEKKESTEEAKGQ